MVQSDSSSSAEVLLSMQEHAAQPREDVGDTLGGLILHATDHQCSQWFHATWADCSTVSSVVRLSARTMTCGSACAGGGAARVAAARAIVGAGVAVMGHVGLMPQAISVLGGFRPHGQTASEAVCVLREAKARLALTPLISLAMAPACRLAGSGSSSAASCLLASWLYQPALT